MIIREARIEDIERILEIYDIAKAFMRQTGNPHQWNSRYPDLKTLEEDIHKQQLFVMEENSIIHSVFAFIIGEDPTYKKIEGAWLDHSTYGTIHRIASDGTMHQVFKISKVALHHRMVDNTLCSRVYSVTTVLGTWLSIR